MEKQKITFDEIAKANKYINTTDIKGKSYAMVNQRVKAFRMLYPEGRIKTEIVSDNDGKIIMKATIYDEDGKELSNAYSYENEGSSNINKTSYIENCETSAIGRALGFCGLGVDVSIASYEEVSNAIERQEEMNAVVRKRDKDAVKEFEQALVEINSIKSEAEEAGIDIRESENIKAWIVKTARLSGSEPNTLPEAKRYLKAVRALIDGKKEKDKG